MRNLHWDAGETAQQGRIPAGMRYSPCRQDIYVMGGVGFGEGHIDHRLDRRAAPAGLVDTTRSQIAFVGGAPSKAGR